MLHELVRRGIGGRTVAEAATRLSVAELTDWEDYAAHVVRLKAELGKQKKPQKLIEW